MNVVVGEGPGEVSIGMQGAFDLVQGVDDCGVVGVVPFVSDGCAFVFVHISLDACGGVMVPATVIRVNDWTSVRAHRMGRVVAPPGVGEAVRPRA